MRFSSPECLHLLLGPPEDFPERQMEDPGLTNNKPCTGRGVGKSNKCTIMALHVTVYQGAFKLQVQAAEGKSSVDCVSLGFPGEV